VGTAYTSASDHHHEDGLSKSVLLIVCLLRNHPQSVADLKKLAIWLNDGGTSWQMKSK
jgi:hypothetical protein